MSEQQNTPPPCKFADEIEEAAREERAAAKRNPELALGYYQSSWCLLRIVRRHARSCPLCLALAAAEQGTVAA